MRGAARFALKHAVAAGVVVGGVTALSAASYFALLLLAVVADEGIGGPLAFPFMVLSGMAASVLAVGLVLMPTTALAEWITFRRRLHVVWQIPIAVALTGAAVLSTAAAVSVMRGVAPGTTAGAATVGFVSLLVPLGAYWWSMQSADWLIGRIKSAYQLWATPSTRAR